MISTLSLPKYAFTTEIKKPEPSRAPAISDEEIERAIAEIPEAIRKIGSTNGS